MIPVLPVRLLDKINPRGSDGCWCWTAATDKGGYGIVAAQGRRGMVKAHRVVYELLVGPIPRPLELDHLCRNPGCVNPAHLEAVTHAENVARGRGFAYWQRQKTHCPQGHEYTPENTYSPPSRPNARYCRECNRQRHLRKRELVDLMRAEGMLG